jgi:pimeloyl-ACP methyl ester carboxylesterase
MRRRAQSDTQPMIVSNRLHVVRKSNALVRSFVWLCLSLCFPTAMLAGPAFQGSPESGYAAKLFGYNLSAPLNFHIEERTSAREAEILTVSYAGARAPVSASIIVPSQAGKHPVVIFMADSGHRRDHFLPEALALARARPPAVSLLIDAPPARPLGWRRSFNVMLEDNDRDIHIQAVIDVRRGIDLLTARADVDPRLIAYVGQSDAANWGAILRSIEPRLRAFVLVATAPSMTDVAANDDPEWADLRYAVGDDRFAQYVSSLSIIDPVKYLGATTEVPVFFQFGRFDPYISRGRAEELIHATGRSGHAIFYDSGHDVNEPQALFDRAVFLTTHYAIGRIQIKVPTTKKRPLHFR